MFPLSNLFLQRITVPEGTAQTSGHRSLPSQKKRRLTRSSCRRGGVSTLRTPTFRSSSLLYSTSGNNPQHNEIETTRSSTHDNTPKSPPHKVCWVMGAGTPLHIAPMSRVACSWEVDKDLRLHCACLPDLAKQHHRMNCSRCTPLGPASIQDASLHVVCVFPLPVCPILPLRLVVQRTRQLG